MSHEEQRVKVGLIGCGNIGAGGHLPAYAHIPEAELVAACDAIGDLAQSAAERSGAMAYSDYRQLLEREDISMVDVCVPTYRHSSVVIAALEAGKNLLCKKPIAHRLEAADAMIEAAEKTGAKLMIGQVRRFDHRYASIKSQIDACKVGRPVFIRRAERQFLPFPPDAWQWDPKRGGGVILDIGIHATDLFRWLFGGKMPSPSMPSPDR